MTPADPPSGGHDVPPSAPRAARPNATAIRLLVSPLVLGLVLGVAWIQVATGSTVATDIFLALAAAAAGAELATLLARDGRGARVPAAALACAALCGVGLLAPDDATLRTELRAAFLVLALVGLLAAHARDVRAVAVDRIAITLVPILFVGWLFTWLREVASGPEGGRRLVWVLLISKTSDMAGWIVGKPFGRHKLAPTISPGKSWEGLAAGLVGSALVAWALARPLGVPEAAWSVGHRLAFGTALGLASVAAGLVHSAWKRRAGAKDSSPLIPEMGGLLDMIDSLLFAAPVAYVWMRLAP